MRKTLGAGLVALLGLASARGGEPGQDVRAVLARCVQCHNPDDRAGDLDLTTRATALEGGENGPVLHPGDAAASPIYRMAAARKMPPKKPLDAEQVDTLRRWINAGAPWEGSIAPASAEATSSDTTWALRPQVRPSLPAHDADGWASNPIDRFILDRLHAAGLRPAPQADRTTLIRRLTFDLTGLPPTPDEIEAFTHDPSPIAYERLVDRLLASPRYGERWGRHWLDVARFAESQGFEYDRLRDHAWRYRDYVIGAFNADLPYDRFITEQLAGDALEPPSQRGIIATGFLVAGPWDEAGNLAQSSVVMRMRMREEELEDTVAAVGQTFLGLTVNCARCHDHKFDPISQADYYRLKAAVEGVRHGNRPALPRAELQARSARIAALEVEIAWRETELAEIPDLDHDRRAALVAELTSLRAERASIPPVPLAYAANSRQPEPTHVLARGDVERPKEPIAAGGLSSVAAPTPDLGLTPDAPEGLRRRRLAAWIAHPDNPLTARVLVNRVWHYHFGAGIVATPNDFGANGERPSHPELLDWLAHELVARGWSLKALHRLILTSSTYQQSSRYDASSAARDAEGRLLWRFPPRRLEAEAIRDAMLHVAGRLNETPGGPSFRPFTVTVFGSNLYTPTDPDGPEFDRRTVYRMGVNSGKAPLLEVLDCPDPSVKTPRRAVTTTPLQALGLMNDPFVWRHARAFARRVEVEAGTDPASRVDRAYRFALGRCPTSDESCVAADVNLEALCWALLNASEFLYLR